MKGINRLIVLPFVLLVLPVSAAELSLGRVQFLRSAETPEAAYAETLAIEQREGSSPKLELAKVALAFDMGMPQTAKQHLDSIDRSLLTDTSRRDVSLYLARLAYGEGDATALADALDDVDPARKSGSWETLLRAERARLEGRLEDAGAVLAKGPVQDVMLAYGRYNLATAAMRAGNAEAAESLLRQVAKLKPHSAERRSLVDRAMLGLASVAVESQAPRRAWKNVENLGSESETGIRGMAMLAFSAAGRGDYEEAGVLWQWLIDNYPWHQDVLEGHLMLPWLVEKKAGQAEAISAYSAARERLETRLVSLRRLSFDSPEMIARGIAGDPEALAILADQYGGRWFLSTVSTSESRAAAARWQRLNVEAAKLERRQEDLLALARVGDEQGKRLDRSKATLQEIRPMAAIDSLGLRLRALKHELVSLQQRPVFDEGLEAFATDEEAESLARIAQLTDRATDEDSKARLAKLQHLIWYRIHDDLSVRAQARLQLIERAEVKRLELVERVGRIESAIAVSRTDEGLSPRTNELMTRTALLADRLDLELGIAGERLLAATRRSTQEQIAAIETRLLHADMALARLQDERLLAVEAAP